MANDNPRLEATSEPSQVRLNIDPENPEVVKEIRENTKGGLEYVFEAVGEIDAIELAFAITGRGGTTTSSGLSHPSLDFKVNHVQLVAEERVIKGSFLGSCVPKRDVPNYVRMFQDGNLPVDQLISQKISLSEINEAFDRLDRGEAIRQIISFK